MVFVGDLAGAATLYNLTRDFSVNNNPNGVWSYGYAPTVGGVFTLMSTRRTNEVPSIPIWSWSVDGYSSPDVHFNASSNNTFHGDGGTFPPRSLWIAPGHETSGNAFAVMRFTAPSNGTYRVQSSAQSYLDEHSGDSEFHVATNGTEVIAAFLAQGAQRITTSNQFALSAGRTIDFIVGRGRDGQLFASSLKLEAEIRLLQVNGPVPPPPPTNGVPVPAGLMAWWPLEGNGTDISGHGHDLTLSGSPTFGAGEVRQALNIDSVNDYGRVASAGELDLGANEGLTMEMWINPSSTSVQQPLLEWTDNVSIVGLHFWISVYGTGSLFANVIDRSGVAHHVSSAPGVVLPNTFTHVAMTYSKASGLAKLYANGQVVASQHIGQLTPETRHALYAGWRPIGGEWHYFGKLDEISLYDRELSLAELAGIAAAGPAGKTNGSVTPPPPPPPTNGVPVPAGLVAWWPFDGNAEDISGAEHDMALFGNPAFADGEVQQSVVLDGAQSYGRLPANSASDIGAHSGFSAELWIHADQVQSQQPLMEWSDGQSTVGLHLWIAVVSPWAGGGVGSVFANFISDAQVAHHVSSQPGKLTPGTFQHVAMTYSRATGLAKLYANGQIVASTNIGSFRVETRGDLFLARRPFPGNSGAEYAFRGRMDEVTLYSRALSDTQVHSIFAAGPAGKANGMQLPVITHQPQSQTTRVGAPVTLRVQAQGAEPLRYQWFFNGGPVIGATSEIFGIRRVRPRDAGSYSVLVINEAGSTLSDSAVLSVRAGAHTFWGVPKPGVPAKGE